MDAQVFSVFAQELVKEAVTVENLYRGVSSAKNVDLNPGWLAKREVRQAGGGMMRPTSRQAVPVWKQSPERAKLVTGLNQLHKQLKASPIKAVSDRADLVYKAEPKSLYSGIPKFIESRIAGKIKVDPEIVNTNIPASAGKPKLQTPEAQKALTALVASHELAERRVHPKNIRKFNGHLAPEVLLKERNAIARLEGPGAREAADTMAAVRERSGEAQHMRNLLTNAYGPRAAQFLEGDQKVPKAMLRNLRRRLRTGEVSVRNSNPKFMSRGTPTFEDVNFDDLPPEIQKLTGRANS